MPFFILLLALIVIQYCLIYRGLFPALKIFTHDSIIWFGSFYYYVDSIVNGHFPFWDPYLIAGTPFYPNIHGHGLLDPLIAIPLLLVKFIGISPLTAWIYFCLLRLFVFATGAYYLFKHITGCRLSALLSAGILLFSVAPVAFRQLGILEYAFLTPLLLYFLLMFFDNLQNRRKYLYWGCLILTIGISMNISKDSNPKNPRTTEFSSFRRLDDFEDVPWLRKDYITQYYSDYLNRRGERLREIRENINQYLETPEYQLKIEHFSPNQLTVRVRNQNEGYLYYSDGWSRHWKAFDGNKKIPLKVANYNFKAVHLEKGYHTIRFVYDPRSYRYGLIAYCVGLLTSVLACVVVYVVVLIRTNREPR